MQSAIEHSHSSHKSARCFQRKSWKIGFLAVLLVTLWSTQVFANDRFNKAVKHFKEYEVKQAMAILKELENDSSLSKNMKAKVALYQGMSYMFLRKSPEAKKFFVKALKTDASVNLPTGQPSRTKKLYAEVRKELGLSATPAAAPAARRKPPERRVMTFSMGPAARREPPPAARREPPPAARREPPPAKRRTAPPPKKRTMDFGNFSMGPTKPRPRPVRREPPKRDDPPPERREVVKPKKVAKAPPAKRKDSSSFEVDPEQMGKKKTKGGGGNKFFLITSLTAAGVGVALMGGGMVFGMMASRIQQDAQDGNVLQIDIPAMKDFAQGRATLANVFYISGGVLIAGGAALFVLYMRSSGGKKKKPTKTKEPQNVISKHVPPAQKSNPKTPPSFAGTSKTLLMQIH